MFLKETEDEIPMAELKVDVVKTVDYHDNLILPVESLYNEDN